MPSDRDPPGPKPGRPYKYGSEGMVQKSLRLLPSHWEKIGHAGLDVLRAYLDAWDVEAWKAKVEKAKRTKR